LASRTAKPVTLHKKFICVGRCYATYNKNSTPINSHTYGWKWLALQLSILFIVFNSLVGRKSFPTIKISGPGIHPDFASRPWCYDIINSLWAGTLPWPSRPTPTPPGHPCSFFSQTVNTPTGVIAGHALWKLPSGQLYDSDPHSTEGEAVLLVSLGTGLDYFPQTLHGGMVAALIDEAMGLLVFRKMGWTVGVGSNTVTAKMEIKLKGRVETPGVYMIRAWADEQGSRSPGKRWEDMRKLWARAHIVDGDGSVLIEARYLFVRPKGLPKL